MTTPLRLPLRVGEGAAAAAIVRLSELVGLVREMRETTIAAVKDAYTAPSLERTEVARRLGAATAAVDEALEKLP